MAKIIGEESLQNCKWSSSAVVFTLPESKIKCWVASRISIYSCNNQNEGIKPDLYFDWESLQLKDYDSMNKIAIEAVIKKCNLDNH